MRKYLPFIVLILFGVFIGVVLSCTVFILSTTAEELTYSRWVLCQLDSEVLMHKNPNKHSEVVGAMYCGENFRSDEQIKNGYLHIVEADNEIGEGWISLNYVVYDEPQYINKEYKIWDKSRIACRKCIDGKRKCWLKPNTIITVYYLTSEWTVTNKGYVKTEYLRTTENKGD